jgi:UDP-2,4-diacetamido-2,4,6-trideoxy-beta-L-altropyranose hydrolase/pseudaminic acid synthase
VILHIDSKEVAKRMRSAHFAVATPSVTLNELVFLDTPFIAIQTADNQKEMTAFLREKNRNILTKYDDDMLRKMIKQQIERLT